MQLHLFCLNNGYADSENHSYFLLYEIKEELPIMYTLKWSAWHIQDEEMASSDSKGTVHYILTVCAPAASINVKWQLQ